MHSPIAALADVEKYLYNYGTSYGLFETFTICSATPADAPAEERRANSGRPCPGMELRIVVPTTGTPLGVGVEGEIAVKGVTLMRGYYQVAPEQVFDADGYYHTQDGGSFDSDGRLHWTGRLSKPDQDWRGERLAGRDPGAARGPPGHQGGHPGRHRASDAR